MRKISVVLMIMSVFTFTMTSCNWVKNKSKETVNKAGEIVGRTGSEFGDGIYKGVKKTFENDIKIADQLKNKGVEFGEVLINSTDSTTDNVLTVYVIFKEDFDQEITFKIFNESGKEYGRLTQNIKGEKDKPQHFDFVFDKHVNIGIKGNITIE